MKALVFVAAWVGLGAVVAFRRPMSPVDRALALLFWPFFLAGEAPAPDSPVGRLAARLDADPATQPLAAALRREEARLAAATRRLAAARAEGAGARSAAVLDAALAAAQADLDRLRELADVAGARLLVAAARSGGADAVLADLRAHLAALDEVEATRTRPEVEPST